MTKAYIPIRLSTLKADIPLGFLLHLKLNESYVKYILPENPIEKYQLSNLKDKKIKKVYIKTEDEKNYQTYLDNCLLKNETSTNVTELTEFVSGFVAASLENIYAEPDSVYSLAHSEKAAESIINATNLNPEVLKELFRLENEDDISISCAICTSSTAVTLARLKKLTPEQIKTIATASLLCDISLPRLHTDYQKFFTKELSEFSATDVNAYKEHPNRSAELLQNIPSIPSSVLGIISNHEEMISGKGFPKGTNRLNIEEKIVSLSNKYALLVMGHKIPKEVVLKNLFLNDLGSYDLELMNLLKKTMDS